MIKFMETLKVTTMKLATDCVKLAMIKCNDPQTTQNITLYGGNRLANVSTVNWKHYYFARTANNMYWYTC